MNGFWSTYNKIEEALLSTSLLITIIVVTIQIAARYIFNSSITWSEELTRYIFIWQIWLGTSYGMRNDGHLRVSVIYDKCSIVQKRVLEFISLVILILFCFFLFFSGLQLTLALIKANTVSPAMRLPMYYVYAALPVSNLIVMIRLVNMLVSKIKLLMSFPVKVKE